MDNLEEMYKFLEMYSLPRQNQEEIENINRLITSNAVESVIIKKTPNKQNFSLRQLHSRVLPNI